MTRLHLLFALNLAACAAGGVDPGSLDGAVETHSEPIVRGTDLDAAGTQARGLVGLVAQLDTVRSGYCSGTLIADRIVLTAAHCAATPRGPVRHAVFAREQRASGTTPPQVDIFAADREIVAIASFVRHRTADLAVAHLATDAPARFARIPVATLVRAHSGRVDIAGFGRRDPSLPTTGGVAARLEVFATFAAPGSPIVTVTSSGTGACAGDSGGPVFLSNAAGQRAVLGALSNGNPSCRGGDTYVSASHFAAFLREQGGGVVFVPR